MKSNQTIFGVEVQKQMLLLKDRFNNSELFSPKGLLGEKELEAIVVLSYQYGKKIDLT